MNAQNSASEDTVDQIVDLVAELNSRVRLDKDLTYLSDEQYDRLADGINDLSINIYNRKLVSGKTTDRLDKLTDMMTSLSALDFSKTVEVTESENHLDYIATGLNLMRHHLKTSISELQLYKRIFESRGDLILVVNPEGIIKFVNENTGLLGSLSKDNLVGTRFEELIDKSSSESLIKYADILESFELSSEHGIPLEDVSLDLLDSDNGSFSINMEVSILRDDLDMAEGFVFSIPDTNL